jgi:predicted secreted protein
VWVYSFRLVRDRVDGSDRSVILLLCYLQSFDPNGHGHGKAGIYNFPFLAVQKGMSSIRLEFARHWENNPQKSFIVTISVQN